MVLPKSFTSFTYITNQNKKIAFRIRTNYLTPVQYFNMQYGIINQELAVHHNILKKKNIYSNHPMLISYCNDKDVIH